MFKVVMTHSREPFVDVERVREGYGTFLSEAESYGLESRLVRDISLSDLYDGVFRDESGGGQPREDLVTTLEEADLVLLGGGREYDCVSETWNCLDEALDADVKKVRELCYTKEGSETVRIDEAELNDYSGQEYVSIDCFL